MKKIGLILTVIVAMCFALPRANAQVSIGISVGFAPPALPVYVQPACPVEGYLWVPGYWAYDDVDGYYWVPGYWAAPPSFGLLWTPAYWGFEGGMYGFHAGYWGPHVGFYGGINYGFGYGGVGFYGGVWEGNRFRYNTAVVNVNTTVVHNTYIDRTVINNVTVNNHASFNGPGGVNAQPRPEELAAQREQHVQPTAEQTTHQQHASQDKSQFAKYNGGKPAATAMDKVGGKPVDQEGHVAANSKLGNQNPNANRTPSNGQNNPANPNPNRNQANQPNNPNNPNANRKTSANDQNNPANPNLNRNRVNEPNNPNNPNGNPAPTVKPAPGRGAPANGQRPPLSRQQQRQQRRMQRQQQRQPKPQQPPQKGN
jgi:hypothetical protein